MCDGGLLLVGMPGNIPLTDPKLIEIALWASEKIGSDLVGESEQWERIEELRRLADFVVVPRGGFGARGEELEIALPALSSSAIRRALREGRSVAGLLSPAVRDYIERHGLYRG